MVRGRLWRSRQLVAETKTTTGSNRAGDTVMKRLIIIATVCCLVGSLAFAVLPSKAAAAPFDPNHNIEDSILKTPVR